jgi:hypothetical protein
MAGQVEPICFWLIPVRPQSLIPCVSLATVSSIFSILRYAGEIPALFIRAQPFEFLEPVLNHCKLRDAGLAAAFDHQEAFAVGGDIVPGSRLHVGRRHLVLPFKQEPGPARSQTLPGIDVDSHHLVAVAVEKLAGAAGPSW